MTSTLTLDNNYGHSVIVRLINAGAIGLKQVLVSNAVKSSITKMSPSKRGTSSSTGSSTSNDFTASRNVYNDPLLIGNYDEASIDKEQSHRSIETVKRELVPLTWTLWLINILSISFYMNETGKHYLFGMDLTLLVHRYFSLLRLLFGCTGIASSSTRKASKQRTCCGCRRIHFPIFHRLHNSYVAWHPTDRILMGTTPTKDEFGFLKISLLQHLILFAVPSLLVMVFTGIVFKDTYGWAPQHVRISEYFDTYNAAQGLYVVYGVYMPGILIALFCLLMLGPTLVGTRKGSLPTLITHLFHPSAPEYMISYNWAGGPVQLARSLGEILPNAWLDVRNLVGGQVVSNEIYSNAANARVLIVLLSPQYLRSRNCAIELFAVVSRRQHKGSHRCHQTIVLIEQDYLDETDSSITGINWKAISSILTEIGCTVVPSVDDLLMHLQSHACRSLTQEDTFICLQWWTTYGKSTSYGSANGAQSTKIDFRVPWNIFGTAAYQGKRRFSAAICSRWFRACFRRRTFKQTGYLSWEENSITTGIHGAWIPYDASKEPQQHADITTQFVLGILMAPLMLGVFSTLVSAFALYFENNPTKSSVTKLGDVFAGFSGGLFLSYILATIAFMSLYFYSNEIFTPGAIMHSPILFPYFVLSEIEYDFGKTSDGSSSASNHSNHTTNLSSNQSNSAPLNLFTFFTSDAGSTSISRGNETGRETMIGNLLSGVMNRLEANGLTAPVLPTATPSKPKRKFTIQFCHDGSPIHESIDNLNFFYRTIRLWIG